MERFFSLFAENSVVVIAACLGAFFLLAAIVKGIGSRRQRHYLENAKSADANGGTPDAPVHIGDPFSTPPPDAGSAADTEPAAGCPSAETDKNLYVWE